VLQYLPQDEEDDDWWLIKYEDSDE